MKNQVPIFIFGLLTIWLFNAKALASPAVYAQISSNQDQLTTADNINRGIVAQIQKVGSVAGINFDSKKNEIIVQEDGVYFLMAVAQMGAREEAGNIVKGGDIYFWVDLNDKAIEESGSWIFASPSARAHTIVEQMIQPLKKGDRIRFKFAANSPSMGLITFDSTEKWPSSPGISVSMYKVN